jgi:hypothetical protein
VFGDEDGDVVGKADGLLEEVLGETLGRTVGVAKGMLTDGIGSARVDTVGGEVVGDFEEVSDLSLLREIVIAELELTEGRAEGKSGGVSVGSAIDKFVGFLLGSKVVRVGGVIIDNEEEGDTV